MKKASSLAFFAVLAKPGEYVQLIGLDGTVLKTLDTVSGKQVEKVTMADNRAFALFDLKGEPVVKASKHINKIRVFKGEEFVYYDGDNYGLMNTEGQVLMEPEYDDLWFFGDKLMLAGWRTTTSSA